MVTKIASGCSLYSALAYNHQKVKEGHAKVLLVNNMIEPPNGNFGIGICTSSFEPYLQANKRTENPIIHISLNPDPTDKLNDEKFSEIAQEYMQKLGYGNQPFIVYKHEDIDRHHLHVVSVKVDETGKMIRDNFQHRLSMRICRELEKKYGLVRANEKQKAEGYTLKKVDFNKGNIKQQIANVVRPVSASWHFQTFNEYKALLSIFNVHVSEVKGEYKGKPYTGIVYATLDEKGKVCGTPIKSSKIGKTVGKAVLEQRMAKSKILVNNKNLKERPKTIIAAAIQKCRTQDDFEKELLKSGISVLLRKNDSGRIYGVTFIDHKQKFVFNGSRLGKGFSANLFHEKFNNPEQPTGETTSTEQEKAPNQYDSTSSIDNLSGLLGIENHGENPEEEAFIRKIKRKKRYKRKL
ncbi:conjugal transfer protein MobB [uncultured Draconibacterium sp.]|uniref:conjugal transfer protein MobB n=1 Tax=uncultured Draconibacterium sp. TaxID=1573823 RepID=UPI003216B87F